MSVEDARKIMRYRNRVNRELQEHHGFRTAVSAPLLVQTMDQGLRNGWEPNETAAVVAQISAHGLANPAPPNRGN